MSESRPKKCSHCSQPATLHLTKIVNGQMHKLALCAACPQAAQVKSAIAFDLIDLPSAPAVTVSRGDGPARCPSCGLTPSDFKELGRLGCGRCYEVFDEKLSPMLGRLHNGAAHRGKAPKGKRREISLEELAQLKRRLEEYVSREEYELAAVVRDQIRQLER